LYGPKEGIALYMLLAKTATVTPFVLQYHCAFGMEHFLKCNMR